MAVALSPWPTTPAARANAIERLKQAIGGRAESDAEADALGRVASARVEIEAPAAPAAARDEAVIRYAGYMAGADFGGIRREEIGPLSIEFVANHAPAWRNCGAAGLLSPWKIRRAGVVG